VKTVTYPFGLRCIFLSMPLHQKLKAWQHSQRLAVECAKAAHAFPEYEQDNLADQLRRASYSVPLNIAEGSSRRGSREYRKYLDTAWSSLAEVQTALEIARDIGYLEPADFGRLEALAVETSKTLFGLLKKISESSTREPKPR
jgi:four helix bundle protein